MCKYIHFLYIIDYLLYIFCDDGAIITNEQYGLSIFTSRLIIKLVKLVTFYLSKLRIYPPNNQLKFIQTLLNFFYHDKKVPPTNHTLTYTLHLSNVVIMNLNKLKQPLYISTQYIQNVLVPIYIYKIHGFFTFGCILLNDD